MHAPPLDFSSTYPLHDLDEAVQAFDALACGHAPVGTNPVYARLHNPTVRRFETALSELEGTTDAVAFASGMAALTASILAASVVAVAGAVPVLVDNTFATPILQNPSAHGAAYVLQSATKFLGGHGDVVAGIVATSRERAARLRQVRILTGALLHPLAAYLLHRSLPTLSLRVHAAQQTATILARRLARHDAVERVLYPEPDGLQLRGPGAILAFEVSGGLQAAARVMGAVALITPAVSLGSTDTLIQHPAGLTHRLVPPEVKAELGITDGLLRVSVGLEDAEDLWDDLVHALAAARVRAAA